MHLVACLRSAKAGPVKLEEFRLKSLGERESEPADGADEVARFDAAAGAKWTR
jgi:hypothetical protein